MVAMLTVNQALVLYPQEQDFINKKTAILVDTKNYGMALAFLASLTGFQSNAKYIRTHTDISLLLAAELLNRQEPAAAIGIIEKGLSYDLTNIGLLEQAMNAYATTGRATEAIGIAEKLISATPANQVYRFKKAGLLEAAGRNEEASEISNGLMLQYPLNARYRQAFIDEITAAEKQSLAIGQPQKTIDLFARLNDIADPGKPAFQYVIAAYSQKKQLPEALAIVDTALTFYPADSLFTVKRSITLQLLDRYQEAIQTGRRLVTKYPGDLELQQFYLEQLSSAGKYYERGNRMDSALIVFLTAHQQRPADTFALENLSAIYFSKKQYDSSIYYAGLGLAADSNNAYLLMKEASAYEQLKEYPEALQAASRAVALQPTLVKTEYLNYLRSKTFVNQVGMMHLQSVFSSPDQFTSITGVRYMRRFKGGSVGGQLNVGQRPAGSGVQGGLDIYITHNTRYYSNLFVNASTGAAFPYWQMGYSVYRNMPKDWEIELGGRYLGFDTAHVFTAVGAVAKYLDKTWLNLRGFYGRDAIAGYASAVFTLRQYLNEKRDYLSFVAGTGKTPDDPGLVNHFANYRGYRTATIGIGFQKVFRYRTFLQGSVNYTNLSIPAKRSLNQYDFYLSLFRNF